MMGLVSPWLSVIILHNDTDTANSTSVSRKLSRVSRFRLVRSLMVMVLLEVYWWIWQWKKENIILFHIREAVDKSVIYVSFCWCDNKFTWYVALLSEVVIIFVISGFLLCTAALHIPTQASIERHFWGLQQHLLVMFIFMILDMKCILYIL